MNHVYSMHLFLQLFRFPLRFARSHFKVVKYDFVWGLKAVCTTPLHSTLLHSTPLHSTTVHKQSLVEHRAVVPLSKH